MLQASEGGSVSLGRSLYKVKTGQTPTPAPLLNPAGIPKMVARTSVLTERVERRKTPPGTRSSAIANPGEVVISKNTLVGLCLTAFACGIVITLAIERGGHNRAIEHEAVSTREVDPTLARRALAQPAPAAPVTTAAVAVTPPASDPVVVKLTPTADSKPTPPPAALPRKAHVAAPTTAPPVHPAAVRAKRAPTPATDSDDDTEAAPAAPAQKWVDPFAD